MCPTYMYIHISLNICVFVYIYAYILKYANLCACVIIWMLSNVQYLYTDLLIYLTYLQNNDNDVNILFYI